MNMNLSELINEIISEWAYRVNDGMPDAKNPAHLKELSIVLNEMGLSHIKDTLVENLLTEKGKTPQEIEEADKTFTNPILNKKVTYKSDKGEDKEGIVGNLLRQPKESPGRKAAEAMLPPEGSPERETMNQELGGENQPGKDEDPKAGGGKEDGAPKEDPIKKAAPMFDPKADPAMGARMDREKEANAKIAADDEKNDKVDEPNPLDDKFNPIDAQDVAKEMPQADTDTFGGGSDIPDGIPAADLQKFNTDIDKVAKQISDAKERGEKAPNINLCDVTVAGTNLYCDDNLGIPREQMPQFKGKPQPGTPAADMPLDKNGDVDTEPLFKKMLEDEGIKMVQTEVPADKLKATQSELVADKVIGMMNTLENDPTNESLTAPIYVSRDGYVIDGHHRWAAITAYNAKHPDNQIPMKVQAIDMDAKDAIPMCNDFAEKQGVAAKKADANNENPTKQPNTGDEVPDDKQANEQIAHEKEGLSHEENQAYEYLDGMSDEDKAEAIDKALNDRTIIQKAMQDTMVGNWLMKKGKMLKNVYKAVEQKYKTGRSGTTKDCSDAPKGPHANTNETIKEAPQNRQDYLASLDKTGKKKKKADDSKCKDVHVEDYQKRDEEGNPKYKTVPVYESGEKPDPADFGADGSYYTGLMNGYVGPREPGTAIGGTTKENAFKASELDSKTGYFKRDGKYYDKDGDVVNEGGQKLDAQGNTTQKTERCWLCFPPGKKVPSTQEVADLEDDLTPEQKHVAHHAEHVEHERKHAVKHLAIEASLIIGGALAGPWLLAKAGISGAAAGGAHVTGTAAKEVVHHGAGEIIAHIAKDFGKHALAETLGVSNPYAAAGSGLAASALSGGILESFWKEIEGYDLVLEGVGDKNDEGASKDFFEKLCRLGLEKMKTYKMTPQQKLESIRSYKFEKAEKEKEKEKKDKLKDLASVLKEQLSESKEQSIQNFVEYASKRLNLKETPKINLMSGNEFKNELAALGGYDPSSKEIFVATDGRLTADILRTIAHEMVHRKQEEKGFLKDIDKDGADGSEIENQANSIAGILMREYGKLNKEIYNESHNENKKEKTEIEMKYESLIKSITNELISETIHGFINEATYPKSADGKYWVKSKKTGNVYTVIAPKPAQHDVPNKGDIKNAGGTTTPQTPTKKLGAGDFRKTPDMKPAVKKASTPTKKERVETNNPHKKNGNEGETILEVKPEELDSILEKYVNTGEATPDDMRELAPEYSNQDMADGYSDDDYYSTSNGGRKHSSLVRKEPYKVDESTRTKLKDSGFPEKYIKFLERCINTQVKGKKPPVTELIKQGGAGQIQSQFGEVMAMAFMAIRDPQQRRQLADIMNAEIQKSGEEFGGGKQSPIATKDWVEASLTHAEAFDSAMDEKYGKGQWRFEGAAWDIRDDVESLGLDYKNKGFSTDVMLRVQPLKNGKPNGPARAQKNSLKKDENIFFFNGSINEVNNFVLNYLDEKERKRVKGYEAIATKAGASNKNPEDRAAALAAAERITGLKGAKAVAALKQKSADIRNKAFETAPQHVKDAVSKVRNFGAAQTASAERLIKTANTDIKNPNNVIDNAKNIDGGDKDFAKFSYKAVKECKASGTKDMTTCIRQKLSKAGEDTTDDRVCKVAVLASKVAIAAGDTKAEKALSKHYNLAIEAGNALMEVLPESPELMGGLMQKLADAFPMKTCMQGEEFMCIDGMKVTQKTLQTVFGVSNYDELQKGMKLKRLPSGETILVYGAKSKDGKDIPIGVVGARQKGKGYEGTVGFEISCSDDFALAVAEANSKNGDKSESNEKARQSIGKRVGGREAKANKKK